MKVLHLPSSVGGMSNALSHGERALGLESRVLVARSSRFDYPADTVLSSGSCTGLLPNAALAMKCMAAAFRISKEYDVLHFNYGRTLIDSFSWGMHLLDLPLYTKKDIFVTYNGCDARLRFECAANHPESACAIRECGAIGCRNLSDDGEKKKRFAKFDAIAKGIFAVNPDLMNYLPKRTVFLPYAVTGWDKLQPAPPSKETSSFVIVHAPSNRIIKGTDEILRVIGEAQQRYPGIVVRLVENLAHAEALKCYQEADLVIDQLHVGWYGGFAVEAMKMKKPVAVYIRESDLHYVPKNMACDVLQAMINVNKDTLFQTICELYENRARLRTFRECQFEYVHQYHEPIEVAKQTKMAYEKVRAHPVQ